MTLAGVALFVYFVQRVGVDEIFRDVSNLGLFGFVLILFLYSFRILSRAVAWKLSVPKPHELSLRDTLPGVIMGEAMSSLIPLGPIVSGTTKVLAVRHKLPLVVGFATITIENMFYTNMTALLIGGGALLILRMFNMAEPWVIALDILLAFNLLLITFIITIIVRQWHLISGLAEMLQRRGIMVGLMERSKFKIRLFENLFFDFYRNHYRRIPSLMLCQVIFHTFGIIEVWYILSRLLQSPPGFINAFLFESVNRGVIILFKMIPFSVGVDEAGAELLADKLALAAGVGATLAIIRKGRTLFWTAIGVTLVIARGLHRLIFLETGIAKTPSENL